MFKKLIMKYRKKEDMDYINNSVRIPDPNTVSACVSIYPRETLDRIRRFKKIYIKSNYD